MALMTKVLYALESSRLMLLRLTKSELKNKRVGAQSRLKFVEQTSNHLEQCLHPEKSRLSRGNQYANWTVCGACGSRLTYTPKSYKAKAKPKRVHNRPSPATVEEALDIMEPSCTTREALFGPPQRTSSARGSTDLAPVTEEMKMLSGFLQGMMTSMMQQSSQVTQMVDRMGSTTQSLANNQSQMLMMMSNRPDDGGSDVSMNMEEIHQRVRASMTTQSESNWSMPENPNQFDDPETK